MTLTITMPAARTRRTSVQNFQVGQLGRRPRAHEGVEDDHVGVRVPQRGDPGAAVDSTRIPARPAAAGRRTNAVSPESGSRTTRPSAAEGRDVARQAHRRPADGAQRLARRRHQVEHHGDLLQVVELQPVVVEVDVGLVGPSDLQGEGPWVGDVRNQPGAVTPGPQHQIRTRHGGTLSFGPASSTVAPRFWFPVPEPV